MRGGSFNQSGDAESGTVAVTCICRLVGGGV